MANEPITIRDLTVEETEELRILRREHEEAREQAGRMAFKKIEGRIRQLVVDQAAVKQAKEDIRRAKDEVKLSKRFEELHTLEEWSNNFFNRYSSSTKRVPSNRDQVFAGFTQKELERMHTEACMEEMMDGRDD